MSISAIVAAGRTLSLRLACLRIISGPVTPSKGTALCQKRYTTAPSSPDDDRNSDGDKGSGQPPASKRPPAQAPIRVKLDEQDVEEKHIRGWGNGGQKLNKTSSCVQLLHRPTGAMVTCQDTRYLQQNRKIAYKRLKDKIDLMANGSSSKTGKKIAKLQARKHKQRQRAKKKYHGSGNDTVAAPVCDEAAHVD